MLVYALVVAVVALELGRTLRSPMMRTGWRHARRIRAKHVMSNIPVLVTTMVLAVAFLQIPGLSWGWWGALGGEGNILLGRTRDPGVNSPVATIVGLLLIVVFAAAVPALALGEEQVFRRGSERRGAGQRFRWAVGFGLLHAIMGIPIGVALALGVGGLWFTGQYLRGWREARDAGEHERHWGAAGEALSTMHHIAWNWTLLALLAVVSILS